MIGYRQQLFLLIFAVIFYHSFMTEFLWLEWDGKAIFVCEEKVQRSKWITPSGFVEEVTELPKKIYVSDPTRVSFTSQLSFDDLQKIEEQWIDIHVLYDASICFQINDAKTEKMNRKSDVIQRRLQQKKKQKHD